MPRPRNHIWDSFNLAASTFWEWPVCEMQVFTTKTQNSKSGRAGGEKLNLNCASYHYLFNIKSNKCKSGRAGARILKIGF